MRLGEKHWERLQRMIKEPPVPSAALKQLFKDADQELREARPLLVKAARLLQEGGPRAELIEQLRALADRLESGEKS